MKCPTCYDQDAIELVPGKYKCPQCKMIFEQQIEAFDKKTIEEITKVKDIVKNLLSTDDRCRNDDKWLTYKVMSKFTKIFIPFEDFAKIPTFETIRRTRQYIQNVEHQFEPTDPAVVKKRKKRQVVFQEQFVSDNEEDNVLHPDEL